MEIRKSIKPSVSVDRHYRLSKAAYEKILNRDLNRFPTERDFVSEAVLSYDERIQMKDLLERYKKTEERLDRLYKAVGWK